MQPTVSNETTMIDHCELCGAYASLIRVKGRYLCKNCRRQYTRPRLRLRAGVTLR